MLLGFYVLLVVVGYMCCVCYSWICMFYVILFEMYVVCGIVGYVCCACYCRICVFSVLL